MPKIMDLEIRDTDAHDSAIVDNSKTQVGYGIGAKAALYYDNGLNQAVSLQVKGSPDGSKWFNVGSAISVAAQGGAGDEGYETLAEFHTFLKVEAKCSVAPASGRIEVWLEGV